MSANHHRVAAGSFQPAAPADGPGPSSGPGVTFASTEHFNLQTARALTVSESNGRASIYLAALSSNLIALAFIGQMSRLGTLLAGLETEAEYVSAWCDDGYRTNVPIDDVTGGRAWIAYEYGGEPLDPEHGGPARLLVPHLYFWKSARWVRGLELLLEDRPGFWEAASYHNYGDPWQEQRYEGD